MNDLRSALRQLRANPGFAITIIFTLALGVGVNTALFSVVNTLLVRDLPFKDASRLVYVTEFWPHEPVVPGPPSPDFENWRRHVHLADAMAAYGGGANSLTLTGQGDPIRLVGTMVTAQFLDLIGARLELGRNFNAQEDSQGGPFAVILTARLWRDRFGSSKDVIGRQIQLNGTAYTVAGVLPVDFTFPDNNFSGDVLVPMRLPPSPNWHDDQNFRLLRVIAHMKPGATVESLRSELLSTLASTKNEEPPQMTTMRRDLQVRVIPLRDWLSGDIRTLLLVLQAAVLLVLLIGCVNVANLQIARSIARHKEMALKMALGAGRARLLRQLLTEGLLYALLGGLAGLLAGNFAIGWIRIFLPANLHLADRIRIDPAVLAFTLAIAVAAGLATGFAPVIAIWRTELIETLKTGAGRATASASHQRLRGALVVAEIATAIVLLSGAGLLIRNFLHLANLDPGFDPANAITAHFSPLVQKYPSTEKMSAFLKQVLERAQSIPGARAAAVSTWIPPNESPMYAGTGLRGHPVPPGARPSLPVNFITPDYFQTLGIPIVRGRAFTAADENHPVAIVSEEFAAKFFPGEDAVGKFIEVGSDDGSWREIAGIARNVRVTTTRTYDAIAIYLPFPPFGGPSPEFALSVKSASSSGIVGAVHSVDPDMAVYDVATMRRRLADSVSRQRANMWLMGTFALVAFVLAALGIFSVLADFVARRSHEIGVRVALGAQSRDVVGLVVRQGMVLAALGIAIGIAAALAATPAMRSLLSGIPVNDPATFASVALIFGAIAAAACYLPARRASRLDPITVLREE